MAEKCHRTIAVSRLPKHGYTWRDCASRDHHRATALLLLTKAESAGAPQPRDPGRSDKEVWLEGIRIPHFDSQDHSEKHISHVLEFGVCVCECVSDCVGAGGGGVEEAGRVP